MLFLYYKIWIDAIVYERARNGKKRNWVFVTTVGITFFQGMNLLILLIFVKQFVSPNFKAFINPDSLHLGPIGDLFSALFTLFLPFVLLNYFLILRNHRYGYLVKKYHNSKGKYFLFYILFSFGLLILLLTGVLDFKN
jgi:hypothetical protein